MSDMAGGRILRAARLFVLLTGGILAGMVPLGILPSLTQMADHFSGQGDGTLIAQNVITIVAPTMALGAPLIGWLTELFGKRPVFLISAVFFALAGAAGAIAPDLWTLLASRIVLGLAAAGVTTITIAYIGDYYSGEQRDRLIGWYTMIGSGGSFSDHASRCRQARRYRRVAGQPFLLYLVGLPIVALAIPTLADAKDRRATAADRAGVGSIRNAFGIYALILVLSVVAVCMADRDDPGASPGIHAQGGRDREAVLAVQHSHDDHGGRGPGRLYLRFRAPFIASTPRLGFLGALALVWAAFGLSIVGFALTADVVALGFLSGLSGFAAGLMQPLTQSAVLNVVPQQVAARAIGPAVGFHFLGQFLHPFAFLPLHTALGGQAAFLWAGAASLVAGGATLLWQLRAATRRGVLS